MRADYFSLFQEGLAGQLALLSLPEKLEFFERYKSVTLIEGTLASFFINSFINEPDLDGSPAGKEVFLYYLNRVIQAQPLNVEALGVMEGIAPHAFRQREIRVLEALRLEPSLAGQVTKAMGGRDPAPVYPALLDVLKANPAHAGAAMALLELDAMSGNDASAWLDDFRCPGTLKAAWRTALFLHYARQGLASKALALWEELDPARLNAYLLTHAGCARHLAGDRQGAVEAFQRALWMDPTLYPVKLRLNELLAPLRPDPALLRNKKTAICLYSWNKAAMLERTLRSLAATDTGQNPIFVLLNGCTDDSLERVQGLASLLGEERLSVISLPVNVGAPAARNWLIRLPEVQACDAIAFMDDDVVLQTDWLARMLTEMENHPRAGVVGCKVTYPRQGSSAPLLQFLYRTISLFLPGALKLTAGAPFDFGRDTGLYDYSCPALNVMGCLHVLRMSALREVGDFDLRFSPSQVDDIDHDLCTCLKGWKIRYCGTVTCEHHQHSGVDGINVRRQTSLAETGGILGNDLKLNYKHAENMPRLRELADAMHLEILSGRP